MKIVILDGWCLNPGDLSWAGFEAMGPVTAYDRTPLDDTDEIVGRIGDCDIVLTNKTPITREVLDRCPAVRYIGVLATGYNVVDTQAAAERSIPVCNVPGYGTEAVAQFAIALLLEICHHIGEHDRAVHAGQWSRCPDYCFWNYPLVELAGKLINRDTLRLLKDGAILLHPSRGQLPAEHYVADALAAGKLAALGVDVAETEPIAADSPLLSAKNCIITPHISWAALETRQRLLDIAVENLRSFAAGQPVHVVNGI